jgi:hypothetical protein
MLQMVGQLFWHGMDGVIMMLKRVFSKFLELYVFLLGLCMVGK